MSAIKEYEKKRKEELALGDQINLSLRVKIYMTCLSKGSYANMYSVTWSSLYASAVPQEKTTP